MKANYPYRIDEANGIVYAWFTKMEYIGGAVTSDLEPKLILFEDKYYDIYQKVGNDIFADLFHKMHSNIRQFFPLDEVQKRETYLWFENDELVGSIRIYHNKEENCYEIESDGRSAVSGQRLRDEVIEIYCSETSTNSSYADFFDGCRLQRQSG